MPIDVRELDFDGAAEFLEWLYALDRRPWLLTSEKLLPIVHLHLANRPPDESRKLLAALRSHWQAYRLRGARQCALLAPSGAMDEDGVERLLASAAAQFFQRKRLGRGRGAPHFALASWLATLRREDGPRPSEDEVFAQLAAHFSDYQLVVEEGGGAADGTGASVPLATISDLPWWIKLPAYVLPRVALHIADALFGPQRWFEHRGESRIGDPQALKGSLFALAKRFAGIDGQAPTQEQVDALLADALLEDLRRAYSRAGVFGRGRRRRTYPVLLLGCEYGEAPIALLRAITSARNMRPRHGEFKRDPLLVVAAGSHPATEVASQVQGATHPGSPESAHMEWRKKLRDGSRQGRVWLLPFMIPTNPLPRFRDRVMKTRPPRRVPWMSFVGLAVLVAGVVAVPVSSHEFCRPWWSLSVRPWPPGVLNAMTLEDLGNGGEQCVGLAGGNPPRVSGELAEPVNLINRSNARVVRDPDHITVVHLTMLSPGNEQGVQATREELRGLAIAQQESLNDETPIRLLLANAGANMEYADRAAQKITEAARRDRRIVGVVGLGLSTRQTIDTVRRLGRARLPSVGSATTADELIDASPYYYQVSPGNQRQAVLAARYASAELDARRARVYHSADPDDIYSAEIATAMRDQLRAAGVEVSDHAGYRVADEGPGASVAQLGRRACQAAERPDEIVVYAGRAEHFEPFLNGMKLACQNRYPRILATDDVSRFVLAGTNRKYPKLRLEYLALASSALWGTNCAAAQKQGSFYIRYNDLFKSACEENRDGRALLTYDALAVIRQAAANVRAKDPDVLRTGGVITGLPDIRGAGRVSGVSGDLDYSESDAPRTPKHKAILILRATEGQPCLVKVEGKFSSQERIAGDCP
ncbi:ABC transporter substrate-binding protein [Actinomadura sp. 9N407]|uniref:ABC transporter substrate-binding protein n=1 Tax=Actinomadura sp. 9N407 TaxID=3375154 RepID=UPI003794A597